MSIGKTATIRARVPGELAGDEKERLLGALEQFVNLADGVGDFLGFGRQNPDFFPIPILDGASLTHDPLPPPCVKGTQFTEQGEKNIWTKVLSWDPACHRLARFYRDTLRDVWPPGRMGKASVGDTFLLLLAIDSPDLYAPWQTAFEVIREAYPSANVIGGGFSLLFADWRIGTFEYQPENEFQRAVYILFREGWRAKVCARCSRRFIASKPMQTYCSPECFHKAKRDRNRIWWNKDGKRLRMTAKASSPPKGKKLRGKRGTKP